MLLTIMTSEDAVGAQEGGGGNENANRNVGRFFLRIAEHRKSKCL